MSRWIDADALAHKVAINGDADFINKVTKLMIDAPSIDIVRCKECRHRTYCYGDVLWTNKRQTVDIHKTVDFCSFGEREGE